MHQLQPFSFYDGKVVGFTVSQNNLGEVKADFVDKEIHELGAEPWTALA